MKKILLLSGDGIGPEITKEALKILNIITEKKQLQVELVDGLMGGIAIDAEGVPLPESTIQQLKEVDAVLLAAIGGPKWENLPQHLKPEKGLLQLRKELDTFANIRPAKVFSALRDASSLKPEIIDGVDLLIVRELTSGIYFGEPRGSQNESTYFNTMIYSEDEIRRVVRVAAQAAMQRDKRLCSVDKANVLEVSQFWRDVTIQTIESDFPEVELSHLYVDNAAMQLINNPRQFDVVVTSNLFGDILSDESAMLTGSIGLLASASLGDGSKPAIYEPVHGSAPDIAGQGVANPIAMILSLGMLLEHSFGMVDEASMITKAIENVLDKENKTRDLGGTLSTSAMGDCIAAELSSMF